MTYVNNITNYSRYISKRMKYLSSVKNTLSKLYKQIEFRDISFEYALNYEKWFGALFNILQLGQIPEMNYGYI